MSAPNPTSSVFLTVIKASGIRKVYGLTSPNSFATVAVDGRSVGQTEPVKGKDPNWNVEFELGIKENSTIRIQIYHFSSSSPHNFRGEALIPAGDILSAPPEGAERTFDLQKSSSSAFGKHGSLTIFYRIANPAPTLTSPDTIVNPNSMDTTPSLPIVFTTVEPPEAALSSSTMEEAVVSSAKISSPQITPTNIELPGESRTSSAMDEATVSVAKISSPGVVSVTDSIVKNVTDVAALDSVTIIIGYLKPLMAFGDVLSEVHPFVKIAWDILTVTQKMFIAQEARDAQIRQLWSTAADMLSFLKDVHSLIDAPPDTKDTLFPIVSAMMAQIYDCAVFLREYGGKGYIRRALRDTFNSASDDTIQRFMDSFKDLKERCSSRTVLRTWKIVRDARDGVYQLGSAIEAIQESEQNKLLKHLPGADLRDVCWDLGNICLPNTRQAVLDDIIHWVNDPDRGSLYWLNGVAGAGKSTVANTVAKIFADLGRLAGSFRFSRDTSERNNPDVLVGNLAYQLAHFNNCLRKQVLSAIDSNLHMNLLPLQNQLSIFIVDILRKVNFAGPVVVVIDALDESGGRERRRKLLRAISAESHNLPSFAKVLLVSRDEADIAAIIGSHCVAYSIDGAKGTTEDIQSYVSHRVHDIRRAHRHLQHQLDWPGEDARGVLAHRAAGLFIWIAVACNYIEDLEGDPDVRLHELVEGHSPEGGGSEAVLDKLYLDVLRHVCGTTPPAVFKYVVGSILSLKTPFTGHVLDLFLGLGKHTIQNPIHLANGSIIKLVSSAPIIASLGSILRGDFDDDKEPVRILHPSLFDFFTTPGRCTDTRFTIDVEHHQCVISVRCFIVMDALERDICKINDPTKMNLDVVDLDNRLQKYIPIHVQYACQFWIQHLMDLPGNIEIYHRARTFLFEHLLHWFEVMSLLNAVDSVLPGLRLVQEWFRHQPYVKSDSVNDLLDDAIRFVQQFAVPMAASAAHIYASCFPFTPSSTVLFKTFAGLLDRIPKVLTGLTPSWPACVTVYETDPCDFGPVPERISAASPNGSRFVFSQDGKVIQILDPLTSSTIGQALLHTTFVSRVMFSRSGALIVTVCGWPDTIRIWDAETGELCGEPLPERLGSFEPSLDNERPRRRGHQRSNYAPTSISLSRDETRIASGSQVLLSVWDIGTGDLLFQIERDGFLGQVVQFAPDGKHIMCEMYEPGRLSDTRVEFRDVDTGAIVSNYRGRGSPTSVILSADGTRAMCKYKGGTMQLWCEKTGASIGGPLESSARASVVFSPNGERFVLATYSGFQLWDVETCTAIGTAVTDSSFLTFSPDGHQYFSSPSSNAIQVWESRNGSDVGPPLVGHNLSARMIAISSDGTRIAASSGHGMILQIWDTVSAITIGAQLRGHAHPIEDIVWSPDGRRIISFDVTTIRIWDFDVAMRSRQDGPISRITNVTPSTLSSQLVATTQDHKLQVWDVEKGSAVCDHPEGHTDTIRATVFSPNDSLVASASSDKSVRLWDTSNGHLHCPPLEGHSDPVYTVAFSPDGNYVISVSECGEIRIWDVKAGAEVGPSSLRSPERQGNPLAIAFLPEANKVVWASDNGDIRPMDATTGALICSQFGKPASRYSGPWVNFLPDGSRILSLTENGTRLFYDTSSGALVGRRAADISGIIRAAAFSPQGNRVVSIIEEATIRIVNEFSAAGPTIKGVSPHTQSIHFSSDGSLLISRGPGKARQIWDAVTGADVSEAHEAQLFNVENPLDTDLSSNGTEIVSASHRDDKQTQDMTSGEPRGVSPDGKRVAYVCRTYRIQVSDTVSGIVEAISEGIDGEMTLPTFSADGSQVACLVGREVIRIWDATNGVAVGAPIQMELEPDRPGLGVTWWRVSPEMFLSWPDGTQFFLSFFGESRVYDVIGGTFSDHPLHRQYVGDSIVSPDGSRRLSRCPADTELLLLDAVTGTTVADLSYVENRGICYPGFVAAFSPDSTRVAFAVNEGATVHLWYASTGAPVIKPAKLSLTSPISISFSPDSNRLLFLSCEGLITMWDNIGDLSPNPCVRVSTNFPPHSMMPRSKKEDLTLVNGWFRGTNGARLLWVPHSERGVFLSAPPGRLVLGRDSQKLTIVDMEPYLAVPQVQVAWRQAGIRYVNGNGELALGLYIAHLPQ